MAAPYAPDDRLIVALDVKQDHGSWDAAHRLLQVLQMVWGFKVGLPLLLCHDGERLLTRIAPATLFLDLKWAGDIPETVEQVVRRCCMVGARFLTVMEARDSRITTQTFDAARRARDRYASPNLPQLEFLAVPTISSLPTSAWWDPDGLAERSRMLVIAGADGLIVSGPEIAKVRQRVGSRPTIVSPGIRPKGWGADSHARSLTPREAISHGADYLVVGRPIIEAPDPAAAAVQVIDEIREAVEAARSATESAD